MKKSIRKIAVMILAACLMFCASLALVTSANSVKADDSLNSFRMAEGAFLRMAKETHGLRFLAQMDKTLADEVAADKTKSFGMIIVPMDILNKYSITDNYIEQLNVNGLTDDKLCLINDLTAYNHTQYGWCVSGAIIGIRYGNIDRDFVGIGYVKTVNSAGSVVSYKYAQANLNDIARNSAEVASYAYTDLNAEYTAEQKEIMNVYIGKATMRALNKTEEEYDSALAAGTIPEVGATTSQATVNSSVGKTIKNDIVYTADGQTIDVDFPASYDTSDPSVATVDKFGNVTVKKVGEATITVNTVAEKLNYKVVAETTLLDKNESVIYSLAKYSSVSMLSKRTGLAVDIPESKVLDLTAYPEGVYIVTFTDENGQTFTDEIDIYDSAKAFEWESGKWADSEYAYKVKYTKSDDSGLTEAEFTNTDGKVSVTTLSTSDDVYYYFYVTPRHSKTYYKLFADTSENLIFNFGYAANGDISNGMNVYVYSDYDGGKTNGKKYNGTGTGTLTSFGLKDSGQLWESSYTYNNYGLTYGRWMENFDKWANGEYPVFKFELNKRMNAGSSIYVLPATVTQLQVDETNVTLLNKTENGTYDLSSYSSASVISKLSGKKVALPESKILDLTKIPEGVYYIYATAANGQKEVSVIDVYTAGVFEWENGTWEDSRYAYKVTYTKSDGSGVTEAEFTNTSDGKVSIKTISDGSDYFYNFYVKPRHSKAYYQLFAATTNNLVYGFGVKGNENNGTNAYFYSDYEKGKYANASESFALKNSGQLWNPDTEWTNFGVTYASWLANLDKWASGEYTYLRFELGGGRINANASIFILPATITSNA